MGNITRNISIQTYDGSFHDIEVNEFYGVKSDGEEKIVISYYDFNEKKSTGAVLIRENGCFVNSFLVDQAACTKFFRSISWRKKKHMDLALLPDRIQLCRSALKRLDLHPVSAPKPLQVRPQDKSELIAYIDISNGCDSFPYFIDAQNAKELNLPVDNNGYHHLTVDELEKINQTRKIVFKEAFLKQRLDSGIRPSVPNIGAKNSPKGGKDTSSIQNGKLSNEEVNTINELFYRLTDFEDYYQFFGVEELRNSSAEDIFKSPRIVELTELFKKAVASGDKVAVYFTEFLEGFKKSLVEKQMNK